MPEVLAMTIRYPTTSPASAVVVPAGIDLSDRHGRLDDLDIDIGGQRLLLLNAVLVGVLEEAQLAFVVDHVAVLVFHIVDHHRFDEHHDLLGGAGSRGVVDHGAEIDLHGVVVSVGALRIGDGDIGAPGAAVAAAQGRTGAHADAADIESSVGDVEHIDDPHLIGGAASDGGGQAIGDHFSDGQIRDGRVGPVGGPSVGGGSAGDSLGEMVDRIEVGAEGLPRLIFIVVGIDRPGRIIRIAVAAALVWVGAVDGGPLDVGEIGQVLAVANRGQNGGTVGDGNALAGGQIEPGSRVIDAIGGDDEEAGDIGQVAALRGEGAGDEVQLGGQHILESHVEGIDVAGVLDDDPVAHGIAGIGIGRDAGDGFGHRDGGLDDLDIDVCFANHGIVGDAVAVGILQHREAAEVVDDVASLVIENVDHHGVDEHADLLVDRTGGQGGIVDHRAEVDMDPVIEGIGVGIGDHRGWRCKTHRRAGLDPDIADVEDAMGQVEEIVDDDGRRGAASKLDSELVSHRLADDQVGDGGIGAESGAGVAFGGGKDRLAEAIERRQVAGDFGGVFVLVIVDPGGRVVEVPVAPALVGVGTVGSFGVEAGPLDIGLVKEARAVGHGGQHRGIVSDGDRLARGQIEAAARMGDTRCRDREETGDVGQVAALRGEGAGVDAHLSGNGIPEGEIEGIDAGGVGDNDPVSDDVARIGAGGSGGDRFSDRHGRLDDLDIDIGGQRLLLLNAVLVGVLEEAQLAFVVDNVAVLVFQIVDHHRFDEHHDLLGGAGSRGIVDHGAEIDLHGVVVSIGALRIGDGDIGAPGAAVAAAQGRTGAYADAADIESSVGDVEHIDDPHLVGGAASDGGGQAIGDHFSDGQIFGGRVGSGGRAGVGGGSAGDFLGEMVDRIEVGAEGLPRLVFIVVGIGRPGRIIRIAVAAALVWVGAVDGGPLDVGEIGQVLPIANRGQNGGVVGNGNALAGGQVEPGSRVIDAIGGDGEKAGDIGQVAALRGEGSGVEIQLGGQHILESHVEGIDVAGVLDDDPIAHGIAGIGIGRDAGDGFGHRDGGLDDLDIDIAFPDHGIVGDAVAVGILQHREAAKVVDDVAFLVAKNVDHHGVDEHADLLVGRTGGEGGIVDHRAEVDMDPVVVGIGVGIGDHRGWRRETHRRAGLDADIADVEYPVGQVEEIVDDDGRRGAASKLDSELVSDHLADDQVGDGGIGAKSGAGMAFRGGKDRLAEAIERRQVAGDFGGVFVLVIVDPGGRVVEVPVAPALVGVGTVGSFGVEAGPLDAGFVEEARAVGHGGQHRGIVSDGDRLARGQIEAAARMGDIRCGDREETGDVGQIAALRCERAGVDAHLSGNDIPEGEIESIDAGGVGDNDPVSDHIARIGGGDSGGDGLGHRHGRLDDIHFDGVGNLSKIVGTAVVVEVFEEGKRAGVDNHIAVLVGEFVDDHGLDFDNDPLIGERSRQRRIVDHSAEDDPHGVAVPVGALRVGYGDIGVPGPAIGAGEGGAAGDGNTADIEQAVGDVEDVADLDLAGGAASDGGGEAVGDDFADGKILDRRVGARARAGVAGGGADDFLGEAVKQVRSESRGVLVFVVIRVARIDGVVQIAVAGAFVRIAAIEGGPLDVGFVQEPVAIPHPDRDLHVVGDGDAVSRGEVNPAGDAGDQARGRDMEKAADIAAVALPGGGKTGGPKGQAARDFVAEGRIESRERAGVCDNDPVADHIAGIGTAGDGGDGLVHRQGWFDDIDDGVGVAGGIVELVDGEPIVVRVEEVGGVVEPVAVLVGENIFHLQPVADLDGPVVESVGGGIVLKLDPAEIEAQRFRLGNIAGIGMGKEEGVGFGVRTRNASRDSRAENDGKRAGHKTETGIDGVEDVGGGIAGAALGNLEGDDVFDRLANGELGVGGIGENLSQHWRGAGEIVGATAGIQTFAIRAAGRSGFVAGLVFGIGDVGAIAGERGIGEVGGVSDEFIRMDLVRSGIADAGLESDRERLAGIEVIDERRDVLAGNALGDDDRSGGSREIEGESAENFQFGGHGIGDLHLESAGGPGVVVRGDREGIIDHVSGIGGGHAVVRLGDAQSGFDHVHRHGHRAAAGDSLLVEPD